MLGTGGFAVVVRAYDEALDGDAAIKILDAGHAANADIRDPVHPRGAAAATGPQPPCRGVHDVGELEDGRPYLVMEFAGGGSLGSRLPPGPGVDPESLVAVIRALADGTRSAPRGRRRAPRREAGEPADPRSSRHASALAPPRRPPDDRSSTPTSASSSVTSVWPRTRTAPRASPTILGGTPHYRAPEQTQLGAAITPAADVFAATGVIWRLVTGELPPPPSEVRPRLVGVVPVVARVLRRVASPPSRTSGSPRCASGRRQPRRPSAARRAVPAPSGSAWPSPARPARTRGSRRSNPRTRRCSSAARSWSTKLVSRLQSASTLVIGGPSGSGKSSLLRAGLIPAIEAGALPGSQGWPVLLFTPGASALKELVRALGDLAPDSQRLPSAGLSSGPIRRSVRPIATSGTGRADRDRSVRGAVHAQLGSRRGSVRRGARRVGGAGREPGADRDLAPSRLLRRVRRATRGWRDASATTRCWSGRCNEQSSATPSRSRRNASDSASRTAWSTRSSTTAPPPVRCR